jgi:hypothetical protein
VEAEGATVDDLNEPSALCVRISDLVKQRARPN